MRLKQDGGWRCGFGGLISGGRAVPCSVLVGFAVGIVAGILAALLQMPDKGAAWGGVLGAVLGVVVSVWIMKRLLEKDFGHYRLAVLEK